MPARKFKKLPLTKRFLTKYSESVAEYQIRRLSNEYVSLYLQHIKIERWRLLRGSGLSEQRLTPLSQCFLFDRFRCQIQYTLHSFCGSINTLQIYRSLLSD